MIPYAADSKQTQEEATEQSDPYFENEKKVKWTDRILLNRPSKVVAVLIVAAVALPIILYTFIISSTLDLPPGDGYSFGSCIVPRQSRLPCGAGNITEQQCHAQCCYDLSNNICFHRIPSRFSYLLDREWTEGLNLQPRVATEPYSSQPTFVDIQLSIDEVSKSHLTLSFYNSREIETKNGSRLIETDYSFHITSPELSVQVNALQGTIFNTNRGPLIAANNIWEISFKLTEESMYGLGDIPLEVGAVKVIHSNREGLNSIPLIYAKSNGSYHGLLVDVETPTEVSIHGDNQIVVRSITTTKLRFHLFVGPEPKDIMHDVMKFTGFENNLKYWMLGAHVCTSDPSLSLEETYGNFTRFLKEAEDINLPYESHCGVTPIVLNKYVESTEILANGAAALAEHGKRFVPHLSPYIYYIPCNDTSEDLNTTRNSNCDPNTEILQEFDDLLLHDSNGFYIGKVNEFSVLYPDYENETSRDLIERLWGLDKQFNGVILENNWPLDESLKLVNETNLHLPYFSKYFEEAFNETLPWNITTSNGDLHMYTHNKYGNHFLFMMKEFSGENATLFTSSQWMNGQAILNRQNIETSWANFRKELTEVALSSVSGHWLQSSPICGDTEVFNPETQTTLCVKWYQASTYLPLIKIHSTAVERHPLAFLGTSQHYIMEAMNKRLSFLPHIYTALQQGPLLRPMFFQFPHFKVLENVTSQFSVGDELLIVPDFLPAQSHVIVWMPPGVWYEFWSGLKLDAKEGSPVQMASTEADFLTLIRGGSVIFMQKDNHKTAEETRLNSNYSITIALECFNSSYSSETTQNCTAQGSIYITNDMSLILAADSERVTMTSVGEDFASLCGEEPVSARVLGEVTVYGLSDENNNFDNYRRVNIDIDLCRLQSTTEISFSFIENAVSV